MAASGVYHRDETGGTLIDLELGAAPAMPQFAIAFSLLLLTVGVAVGLATRGPQILVLPLIGVIWLVAAMRAWRDRRKGYELLVLVQDTCRRGSSLARGL